MSELARRQNGARKIVLDCARVRDREAVLILTDRPTLDVAELLENASLEVTSEVVLAIFPKRSGHGDEPPLPVAPAMAVSDVILMPLSFSMTHSEATRNARLRGARVLSMGDFGLNMLAHGGIEADFISLAPIVQQIADRLTRAQAIRVRTSAGTDLVMDVSHRRGTAETGLSHLPGSISGPPNIEANVGPVEGTASGRLVVDGSIPHPMLGIIEKPIQLEVRDGRVVDIAGGEEADALRAVLEGSGDPDAFNVAELGIGLNPCSRISGSMLEDEGAYGTCHIGIGNNLAFGGHVAVKSHIDLIIRNPTIELDGDVIQEHGKIALLEARG